MMNMRKTSLFSVADIDWKSLLVVLLFFLFIGLTRIQSQSTLSDAEVRTEQKKMVGKLSGAIPINASGQRLKQRSNDAERKITAEFLAQSLAEMNLDVERHQYRMRTIHFLVDLLFPPPQGSKYLHGDSCHRN